MYLGQKTSGEAPVEKSFRGTGDETLETSPFGNFVVRLSVLFSMFGSNVFLLNRLVSSRRRQGPLQGGFTSQRAWPPRVDLAATGVS